MAKLFLGAGGMDAHDLDGLLDFLSDTAQEAAARARLAADTERAAALIAEAEELTTLRFQILDRTAQFELPLDTRKAA